MSIKFTKKYFDSHNYGYTNKLRTLFRRIIKYYPRQLFVSLDRMEKAKILDIGCGSGGLLQKISDFFHEFDLYGMDISSADRPPSGIKFARSNALHLPYKDQTFDMVILSHIIEHIPDPYVLIHEASRVLSPGGQIYIECPSVKSIFNPLKENFFDDPTHIRPYTKRSLVRLLSSCGFDEIKPATKRNWLICLFGLPYTIVSFFIKDPTGPTIFLGNLFGLSISVTATKPETW